MFLSFYRCTIPLQTRITAIWQALTAPKHQSWAGELSGGRGLQVQPIVVSVAALQPSQRPKLWHAIADDRRGDPLGASVNGAWPPDRDRLIGNGGMGGGLQVEPLVVSVAALQPVQWP